MSPRQIDEGTGTIFGTGALYGYEQDPETFDIRVKYDVRRSLAGEVTNSSYVNFP